MQATGDERRIESSSISLCARWAASGHSTPAAMAWERATTSGGIERERRSRGDAGGQDRRRRAR